MYKEKYIKLVLKKLQCSSEKKKEIRKELESDIQTALENGESWIEIEKRMDTPVRAASEFNDNFSEAEKRTAKKVKRRRIIAGVFAIIAVFLAGIYWMFPKSYPIGTSGAYEEESVRKQAEEIIRLVSADDYVTIRNDYANERLKGFLADSAMIDAKKMLGSEWGELQAFGNAYIAEVKQMNMKYVLIQIHVQYANVSVMYTISFDENMKLAGVYMK